MSELPKPATPVRRTGLSPKEQKLQALREKAAAAAGKPAAHGVSDIKARGTTTTARKTAFNRKAV